MFRVLATSSVALFAAAAPVLAEVTPAEVWGHVVDQYKALGYTITEGSREEAGDTLTVTDAVLTMDGEHSTTSLTIPKVVLTQTGDGNVRWSIDEDMTGQAVFEDGPEGETPRKTAITIAMDGDETISSGSLDDLTHETKADSITVTMSQEVAEGAIPITMTLEDVTGKQHSVAQGTDGGEETSFETTAGKMGIKVDAQFPWPTGDGSDTFALEGTLEQLAMNGRMVFAPGEFNLEEQMPQAMAAGMLLDFTMTHGAGSGNFSFAGMDADQQPLDGKGTMSTGPGNLAMAISKDGLHYSASGSDAKAEVQLSTLPMPVSYGMAKGEFSIDFPLMAAESAQSFKTLLSFQDLTLDDSIWALFDPEAKLKRDPADLKIDVSGEIVLEDDLLAPPQPAGDMPAEDATATDGEAPAAPAPEGEATASDDAATGDAMPPAAGEGMPRPPIPLSVTINEVSMDLLGAQANVTGKIAAAEGSNLQETQLGTVEGRFVGVNALLNTLSEMGLIPEEQMMGARMMLAMFAKPVDGQEDTLETKLEFREGGSIFANGQQVK